MNTPIQPPYGTPDAAAPRNPDLAEQAVPGHGVPSQDPDPAAQVGLTHDEAEREAWGEEAVQVLGGADFAARPHLQGMTLLLVAGVQYLLLRSRRIRTFGGVDLRSEAGWLQLKQAIRVLARETFAAAPP